MKKILISMLAVFMLAGCAGIKAQPVIYAATDTAFLLVLQANPQYKTPVIAGLQGIKLALGGSITYDQLMIEIAKQLPMPYDAVAVIFTGFLQSDTPVSTNIFPMSQDYKNAIIVEIDKLILIAGMVK